jgi:hypothetical protein
MYPSISLPLLIAGLLAVLLLLDEGTRKLAFDSNGRIESGSAFGVTVGESRMQARRSMLRRYVFDGSSLGDRRCRSDGAADHVLDLYDDRSWRGGRICLLIRDERVVAISWMFMPIAL